MKNMLRILSRPAIPALTLMFVGAGIAYAAIPDSQGVIYGCYRTNGQLRIIDNASQACNSNETEISWNQAGPQGPPGEGIGGQIIANHLEIPYGSTDPQVLVSIPNLGDLVVSCPGSLTYQNTSSSVVLLNGASQQQVQPGEEFQFGNSGTTNHILSKGSGESSQIAQLAVEEGFYNEEPFRCDFGAVVTLK